ncbi:CPBP family intramembrane glutamic endopeptidase [Companilactobacillus keshanensis]|uniref:CPBP family intramembrane glutamic endopeptidase n=1 Tax=Companilactobacillus keshanensis TaxID=2486003 RepID=A0ABW4BRW4_9LACO|nr:CPBP family intramembrane glutamic endopeptidase [Companilactobacillus keshanensis]
MKKHIFSKGLIVIFYLFVYQLCTIPFIAGMAINNHIGYLVVTVISVSIFGLFLYALWKYFKKDFFFKTNITTNVHLELVIFIVAIVVVGYFSGFFPESDNQKIVLDQLHGNTINTILTTVFLGPVAEELIFRGLIAKLFFPKITDKRTAFWYILVSSLAFGLAHVTSFSLTVIPYILMGVILALAYVRFGDIRYSIFLHFLNNLISAILVIL